MKVFVIAALVAAATAEPYYGGYGYGGYHRGIAGHPTGTSYVGRTIWGLGKRSADAEPEAEAVAAPEAAPEAEPHYGYYGQYAWPSAYGYGVSSTCYGCRGKRSADPEPYYGYGYGLGYYGHGHVGIAGHPGAATSFVARSPQGLGKRSADAEPYYGGYGGYGYGHVGYGYGLPSGYAHFSGAHHYGKRSAEAEPYYGGYGYGGYGYGGYGHGYGRGYGYGHGYGYYG